MGTTEGHAAEVTQPGSVRVRRALLTVSDKRGLVDFARGLAELGVEIVSPGGTARGLSEAGIETRPIDDYTGFPEILDGRVKTLNPRIYAGLLAVRSRPEHIATLAEQDIEPIDLVCVNLYPFERTASQRGVSTEEVVENIDVGGPTLIRAAAKNHPVSAGGPRPGRHRAGAAARQRVRGPGRGDRQAQQPVRVRGGRVRARGLRARLRHRSAERLRRRVLLQPVDRPAARGAPARDLRGGRHGQGLRGGRSG